MGDELLWAVKNGDVEAVEKCLKKVRVMEKTTQPSDYCIQELGLRQTVVGVV